MKIKVSDKVLLSKYDKIIKKLKKEITLGGFDSIAYLSLSGLLEYVKYRRWITRLDIILEEGEFVSIDELGFSGLEE